MKKIVVISDIHAENRMDWRGILADKRKYWKGADMVIFNGDSINWTSDHNSDETRQIVEYINNLCAEDGAEAFIIAGNADYLISDNHYFYHEESATLILHGEVIMPEISPWRLEYKHLFHRFNDFMNKHNSENELDRQFNAVRYAMRIYEYDDHYMNSFLRKIPWVTSPAAWIRLIRTWNRFPEAAVVFAKKYFPNVRRVVVGHFHRNGSWYIDGVEVICTGAFSKLSTPSVVSLYGEKIEVLKCRKNKMEA